VAVVNYPPGIIPNQTASIFGRNREEVFPVILQTAPERVLAEGEEIVTKGGRKERLTETELEARDATLQVFQGRDMHLELSYPVFLSL
jgi:hypothetical protein